MKFIEIIEVSEDCIFYLREVKKEGGEISRGNIEQDYITAPDRNKIVGYFGTTQETVDLHKKLHSGMSEALKEKFIIRADSGGEGCYIRYKISDRGYELLKQANE